MTFDNNLFAALLHTEKGTTCSDSGFQDLSTEKECADAVNYAKSIIGNARYIGSGSWPENHKGCFIYVEMYSGNPSGSGHMYFNKHSSGNNNAAMRSICHKGNY